MDINENTHVYCAALSSIANPTDVAQQRIAFHHGDTQGDMTSALQSALLLNPTNTKTTSKVCDCAQIAAGTHFFISEARMTVLTIMCHFTSAEDLAAS